MILVLVIILQVLTGFGVMAQTRFTTFRAGAIPLAFLIGSFIHSLMFFLVDVVKLGFSDVTLLGSAVVCVVIANYNLKRVVEFYNSLVLRPRFTLHMHDIVTLAVVCALGYYILWAAWYWPVTPFDAMAGIDLVARQAVQEGTIANRVFSDPSLINNLSNQPFYAPYAMLLQVMYRLMGFMYGQVWVAAIAIAFAWTIWILLRQHCHPLIANALWILLLLTPELLGYTYLLQTDYLNAAYFTLGVTFLLMGSANKQTSAYIISALMFAGACWSRSESIIIVSIGLLVYLPFFVRQTGRKTAILWSGIMWTSSLFTFVLWNLIYIQLKLPVQPNLKGEVSVPGLARLGEVTTNFFGHVLLNFDLWGWTFILLVLGFIVNTVVTRKVHALTLLIWILSIMLGLIVVGASFSSAIVEQTLRRGVFKIVPLVYLYLASLPLTSQISSKLLRWETRLQ